MPLRGPSVCPGVLHQVPLPLASSVLSCPPQSHLCFCKHLFLTFCFSAGLSSGELRAIRGWGWGCGHASGRLDSVLCHRHQELILPPNCLSDCRSCAPVCHGAGGVACGMSWNPGSPHLPPFSGTDGRPITSWCTPSPSLSLPSFVLPALRCASALPELPCGVPLSAPCSVPAPAVCGRALLSPRAPRRGRQH